MPIYEFYCSDCHTLFSFLSRSPNTRKRPTCPACGKPRLERRASAFAISKGRAEPTGEDDLEGIDEERMERAMAELAHDAQGLSEDNPREMARLMRRLFDSTGMQLGDNMEEAIRRMEAGEDPDKVEEEMGDLLEADGEPLFGPGAGKLERLRKQLRPARVDPSLYEL